MQIKLIEIHMIKFYLEKSFELVVTLMRKCFGSVSEVFRKFFLEVERWKFTMKLERKMANKLKNQGKLPCAKLMLSIITYCTAALQSAVLFMWNYCTEAQ